MIHKTFIFFSIVLGSIIGLELISGLIVYSLFLNSNGASFKQATDPHPLFKSFQNIGNPIPPYARFDESNPFTFNARTGYWNKQNSAYNAGLKIDRSGFVCNEKCLPLERVKPPNEIRIFIFGGSSVVGLGVTNGGHTISGQMESLLNHKYQRTGKKIRVINVGLGGGFSGQAISKFLFDVILYDPNLVIFFNGHNDYRQWELINTQQISPKIKLVPNYHIYDYSLEKTYTEIRSFSGSVRHLIKKLIFRFPIFHYSKMLAISIANKDVKIIGADISAEAEIKPEENLLPSGTNNINIDAGTLKKLLTKNSNSAHTYVGNLISAAGIARENGILALLCLQPTLGYPKKDKLSEVEKDSWQKIYSDSPKIDQYFEVAAQLIANHGKRNDQNIRYCNATNIFRHSEKEIYWDNMHYTQVGNKIIAEFLILQIKDMLELSAD